MTESPATKPNRTPWIIFGVIGCFLVCFILLGVAVGGYFVLTQSNLLSAASRTPTSQSILAAPTAPRTAVTPSSGATCSNVFFFEEQGLEHVLPNQAHPPYNSNPPTSGWHWAQPQEWGIYSTPQVQEQIVHNLEHGGIVIQYQNLTPAQVQQLIAIVKSDSHHMLLAPNPGLPANVKIAITAWTILQTCSAVDETVIREFIDLFRDQGPETVP
ncbi:MAG: DUF3105 domain-containing protein [Chloroflexi bacterium]|nr:DUF3105 domain-containing protein [Chloroflexota bacterium]